MRSLKIEAAIFALVADLFTRDGRFPAASRHSTTRSG
jgi:hypothetical protein